MTEAQGRESLLREIIDRELAMFLATPNEGGISACQQRPETFRVMRRMAHEVHDDATLASYLDDLRRAEEEGRNFMLEKYARMDERMPPLTQSPLPEEIADAEAAFLEEAARRFPHAIKRNGSDMFRRYLRCELETLSPATLELYAGEIRRARREGRNLVLERHRWLARLLGKGSLKERINERNRACPFKRTGPFNALWSERKDLNLRPPAPKAGALPSCATLRTKTPRRGTADAGQIYGAKDGT